MRKEQGFTLLELLVALTLLGLLMLALSGTLSLGARSWDRLGQTSQHAMVRTTGLETVRMLVEQIQPVVYMRGDGVRLVSFEGREDGLFFAADLGPSSPVPGLRSYRIGLSETGNGLVLETGRLQNAGPEGGNRVPLLQTVIGFSAAYYETETNRWHTTWLSRGKLPDLIRMDLTYAGGNSGPEKDRIIVAPRAAGGWSAMGQGSGGT